MKILIVTDKMDIGGAETHIFTLIKELRKNDFDITLLSAGGVYAKNLEKSKLKCVYAPLDKRDAFSIRKSAKILKKEMKRANIVHTHTRFSSFLAKAVRKNASYPPIVTTAHLNFPLFPFGKLAFWGEKTLAVSEDIKEYLMRNYGMEEDQIKLTQNSIDTKLYENRKFRKNLIIHTSRIDKGRAKSAFLLAEIAPLIIREFPTWRIMIIGDGNLFPKLSKKVNDINAKIGFEAIILTGARSDIPTLLSYGSIFVGVSRAALEGMASGLPCIISGDEGYGGIAENGNFDLLYSTNFCARGLEDATQKKLFRDIKTLITDTDLREKLSIFGRETVKENFAAKNMATDAIDCYNSVLKKPSVCLLGFFGHSNLGDEETLKIAIRELLTHKIKDISVLTSNTERLKSEFPGIKAFNRMNLYDIEAAITCSDILILCGGNLLQNETSTYSLIYYEELISMAKRKGKRIYMLSSGFGKVSGILGNMILRRGLKSCDFCGCRTSTDLEFADKFGIRTRFMPDFCFLLPEKKKKATSSNFAWIISSKQYVKISEIKKIASMRNLNPIAIIMFPDEDKQVAFELKRNNIPYYIPSSYAEFSKLLLSSAFTISERLHGAIFSLLCHTPTYITQDKEKNKALLCEISSRAKSSEIIFPFTLGAIAQKKEIGACDSDFNYVINSLKYEISNAICELFD